MILILLALYFFVFFSLHFYYLYNSILIKDANLKGGKSHFGYVYGFILLGTISLHFILNLMSQTGVNFIRTASVLGYCLLPLVLTSATGVVLSLE